eukprot:TRINITY_DN5497_c0_g1_i1.p1 TRINITY_DN5497_c0_g1~~TRINITY_DN5497_c0_g1_i1.p1  ORF type:complete len:669 (-),score=134.20 TRINITY_DN5497_c0_g1_i1:116-2122(-)
MNLTAESLGNINFEDHSNILLLDRYLEMITEDETLLEDVKNIKDIISHNETKLLSHDYSKLISERVQLNWTQNLIALADGLLQAHEYTTAQRDNPHVSEAINQFGTNVSSLRKLTDMVQETSQPNIETQQIVELKTLARNHLTGIVEDLISLHQSLVNEVTRSLGIPIVRTSNNPAPPAEANESNPLSDAFIQLSFLQTIYKDLSETLKLNNIVPSRAMDAFCEAYWEKVATAIKAIFVNPKTEMYRVDKVEWLFRYVEELTRLNFDVLEAYLPVEGFQAFAEKWVGGLSKLIEERYQLDLSQSDQPEVVLRGFVADLVVLDRNINRVYKEAELPISLQLVESFLRIDGGRFPSLVASDFTFLQKYIFERVDDLNFAAIFDEAKRQYKSRVIFELSEEFTILVNTALGKYQELSTANASMVQEQVIVKPVKIFLGKLETALRGIASAGSLYVDALVPCYSEVADSVDFISKAFANTESQRECENFQKGFLASKVVEVGQNFAESFIKQLTEILNTQAYLEFLTETKESGEEMVRERMPRLSPKFGDFCSRFRERVLHVFGNAVLAVHSLVLQKFFAKFFSKVFEWLILSYIPKLRMTRQGFQNLLLTVDIALSPIKQSSSEIYQKLYETRMTSLKSVTNVDLANLSSHPGYTSLSPQEQKVLAEIRFL